MYMFSAFLDIYYSLHKFQHSYLTLFWNVKYYYFYFARTRADMYKSITPDYYGYRDEDDGILVQKEIVQEVRQYKK